MQIDLREIEALHARYAREPVVIDLENQIRAIPAPLLLSCKPASRPTLARRAWNARWKIGRVSSREVMLFHPPPKRVSCCGKRTSPCIQLCFPEMRSKLGPC